MSIITLTTDFGLTDWFAGTMKGVILGINPRAHLVDITHGVPGGDIRAGAFALAASYRYFQRGTIHVAVVDPGVGSDRRAIAVQTANGVFVGPDNGVLSLAVAREKVESIRRLENARYFLHAVSRSFHGRDIFAPVAAHLSKGLAAAELGPAPADMVMLDWPKPEKGPASIRGEVIYLDRFGNAITNIGNDLLSLGGAASLCVRKKFRVPLKPFYQAVPPGHAVALPGSSGFLEVAVNGGSAAVKLGIKVGSAVAVNLSSSSRGAEGHRH